VMTQPDLSALPHLNAHGEAHMVDVSDKPATRRVAKAEAFVRLLPATLELLRRGSVQKGDALAVARVAGIAASKKTPDLVLLCHPLALSHVSVDVRIDDDAGGVQILTTAETTGPTGVEMEALTAASVAALNLYDMIKKTDRGACIERVRLLHKSGGASEDWAAEK
jgi:cyclic pyranopterin phosphate synthase